MSAPPKARLLPSGVQATPLERVGRCGAREEQLAGGDVPDLQLALFAGQAAGDGETRAVGREADRLDARGEADEPADDGALAAHRGAASSRSVSFTPPTAMRLPSGDTSSAAMVAGLEYSGGCSAS